MTINDGVSLFIDEISIMVVTDPLINQNCYIMSRVTKAHFHIVVYHPLC